MLENDGGNKRKWKEKEKRSNKEREGQIEK